MTKKWIIPKTTCAYYEIIRKRYLKTRREKKNPEKRFEDDAIKIPRDFFLLLTSYLLKVATANYINLQTWYE